MNVLATLQIDGRMSAEYVCIVYVLEGETGFISVTGDTLVLLVS